MLEGEAQELFSERAKSMETGILRKVFKFQVRGDDGLGHFQRLSRQRQHRALCFVLVYGDPNIDDYGSYLIWHGDFERYKISRREQSAVMKRHRVTGNGDDEEEGRFWEASWELMDLAEGHWQPSVLRMIEEWKKDSAQEITRCREGRVDRKKEHFELFHESARDAGSKELIPVAILGPPKAGIVNIQFLIRSRKGSKAGVIGDVLHEVRFYLIENGGRRPWAYARYHCGTAANLYSQVHWSFHRSADGTNVDRKE
jgi:hypothetical protein